MNDNEFDIAQSEMLDAYWHTLAVDPNATAPEELEPGLATLAASLASEAMAPHQDAESAERVRRQVARAMAQQAREASGGASVRRFVVPRPFGVLAAAAVVAALAFGLYLTLERPQAVNAQAVLDRAHTASLTPQATGVRSFELVERWHASLTREGAQVEGQIRRWWAGPERWRVEQEQRTLGSDGREVERSASVEVSDGNDLWRYDPVRNRASVSLASEPQEGTGTVVAGGQPGADLETVLAEAARCYAPRVTGTATVADRSSYVVDLGPSRCPSASAPDANGRLVLWIDRETSFILKHELYSSAEPNRLISVDEVTFVRYNGTVDPTRLVFDPPQGAAVTDNRPMALATPVAATGSPALEAVPTAEAPSGSSQSVLVQALKPMAQGLPYPVFAPEHLPEGLVPRQPKLDPADAGGPGTVRLEFVPAAAVDQDVEAMAQGVQITEQLATYEVLVAWTEGAVPVSVPEGKAWVRRGVTYADGTGTNSAALALRGGTLVTASSFSASPEALLEVVTSLAPVPGGHVALGEPAVPGLADIRREAGHPVFVPTWVPDGWRPEPPVGTSIGYHDGEGRKRLTVVSSSPEGGTVDPRRQGQPVTLPGGITAHLLGGGGGEALLRWEQDGANVTISGPDLSQETLERIAASMSASADLEDVELPPALSATPAPAVPRPTATATPSFAVLRPTWLPEPMEVREQVDAAGVTLGFVPSAKGQAVPAAAMTLSEMPAGDSGPATQMDPQATVERIGQHEVTVVRRGGDCTSFEWTAGGLHLVLTNVYDPPGQLKYSCEQLRKVVESVR